MTALVAHWEPEGGALRLCNCGHVAPLLIRADGEAERPDCGRKPTIVYGKVTPPTENDDASELSQRTASAISIRCSPG